MKTISTSIPDLPIDAFLPQIVQQIFSHKNFILQSGPGSGKTTRVPVRLMQTLRDSKQSAQKILVLVPRRVAAKFAAQYMASLLGEEVGQTVGYAFRFERRESAQTRILLLTEGTFLRKLQSDRQLKDVGVVILDEFHERHLQTDLALGLLVHLQKTHRPQLKIVIMSATLDSKALKHFLPEAGELVLPHIPHPLALHYLDNSPSILKLPVEKKVAQCLLQLFTEKDPDQFGDILVFLPGIKEIQKTEQTLTSLAHQYDCCLLVLHGDRDRAEQDQVMGPMPQKKIILSTNIAESSVTIPGVNIVIDSGLMRQMTYSPWSGLGHLETKRIPKSSAIQRAGRAARTGPGDCYRLYSKNVFDLFPPFEQAEIHRTDLSSSLLSLAPFSICPWSFAWFEAPHEAQIKKALAILFSLGAIDKIPRSQDILSLTSVGEAMNVFPLPPRFARVLLASIQDDSLEKGIEILLTLLDGDERWRIKKQLEDLFHQNNNQLKNLTITKKNWAQHAEKYLLHGFIDRVGRIRPGLSADIVTASGETLKLAKGLADNLDRQHPFWLVSEIGGNGDVLHLHRIEEEWLYEIEPFPLNEDVKIEWDEKHLKIRFYESLKLGVLTLSESSINESEVLQRKLNTGIAITLLKKQAQKILQIWKNESFFMRLSVACQQEKLTEKILSFEQTFGEKILEEWFENQWSFGQEEQNQFLRHWENHLLEFLWPGQTRHFEQCYPMEIQLQNGRKMPIHYDLDRGAYLEGFIQEFYGVAVLPKTVVLTFSLLGPHKRPIQVTKDLIGFWQKTYPLLKKELSREYPKHHWPEDPIKAPPIIFKKLLPLT